MSNIVGIDPGAHGAMALIFADGNISYFHRFKQGTEKDAVDVLREWMHFDGEPMFVYLEKVHAMPKQGVCSVWSFAHQHGVIEGALNALQIPYELITPQCWQKYMGCLSHGDKNITKAKAQQLFPDHKINHDIADAFLIAEYGRRVHK